MTPTWDDPIRAYFTEPAWLPEGERTAIAATWNTEMTKLFQLELTDYDIVRSWAVTIYYHLHSRSMPLTDDERQFFPDDVLETFRTWVNEGCRRSAADPIVRQNRIPAPRQRPVQLAVRKNILELTDAELLSYRLAVERLGATTYPTSPEVPWQRIAYLHTDWCLHYQEAFLLWHRACLLYFESQLGMPVPYWNWMSPRIADDGDPAAGLPRAFTDATFVDDLGRQRPNPLRFAIAKDGVSKAAAGSADAAPTEPRPDASLNPHLYTAGTAEVADADRRYVHRNPLLYTPGNEHRAERQRLLDQLLVAQRQVQHALGWPTFSPPEGSGYPWANIPTFPAPDRCYKYKCDFDGRYEQPHDNYHGWVGPDMADNAFTAFDPVFWSHHSNIDRVFELWLRAHPSARFTTNFPLRPFVGRTAHDVELGDPRAWVYTTIGDMARDSRILGYTYSPSDDVPPIPPATGPSLHVAFDGVRCTLDSYSADVFVNQPDAAPIDATIDNPHYVGRVTRIGMGVDDTNGRCISHTVTRVLNADHTVAALGLEPHSPVELTTIVTEHSTGRVLTKEETANLPGLMPDPCWGTGATPDEPARTPVTVQGSVGSGGQ